MDRIARARNHRAVATGGKWDRPMETTGEAWDRRTDTTARAWNHRAVATEGA
jgi:hypothetical protein